MTRGRPLTLVALLSVAGIAVLAVILWHYVLAAAGLWFAYRILRWKHGPKGRRRPKSSWSSLGRTAALMFAAWNSRFLKHVNLKASVPAKAGLKPDEDFGEIPF